MKYNYNGISVSTIYLDEKSFEDLKLKLFDFGILKNKNEQYALAYTDNETTLIVINKKEFTKLNKSKRRIIIAHELAHTVGGIEDDEKADIWALESLNKKDRDILIKDWSHRNGHPYKGKYE